MYLRMLKTLLVDAFAETFNPEYPDPAFRNLNVTLEYPNQEVDFPGVWVDFESSGSLLNVGIGHVEYAEEAHKVYRWNFEGTATYTIVALTSLERDTLYDELIRVLAFGPLEESNARSRYRSFVEDNPYIAVDFQWDRISTRGESAIPGTPWDTDDVIYETTIAMNVRGEFISDPGTATLLPLAEVVLYPYNPRAEVEPLEDW